VRGNAEAMRYSSELESRRTRKERKTRNGMATLPACDGQLVRLTIPPHPTLSRWERGNCLPLHDSPSPYLSRWAYPYPQVEKGGSKDVTIAAERSLTERTHAQTYQPRVLPRCSAGRITLAAAVAQTTKRLFSRLNCAWLSGPHAHFLPTTAALPLVGKDKPSGRGRVRGNVEAHQCLS
jgi:hypothetical protein